MNEAQAKVDEFKRQDVAGNDQSEEEKAKTAKMLEDLESVEQPRDLSDSTQDLGQLMIALFFMMGLISEQLWMYPKMAI